MAPREEKMEKVCVWGGGGGIVGKSVEECRGKKRKIQELER